MAAARRTTPDVTGPPADAWRDKVGAENFTVASRLLPRRVRADLLAVYAFARMADDVGDEAGGDRGAQLDWLEAELERSRAGTATHPVLCRLGETIGRRGLPMDPFRQLIAANRLDQLRTRYATFEDLLGYCALSAVPVGRLVLALFGAVGDDQLRLADQVCIGLQLVEHCQDVGEDAARGRIYLPAEDLNRFGCAEEDLCGARATPALRRLLAFEADRAAAYLGAGAPLAATLRGRARLAVAGYVAGGQAALDAIAAADHDVLAVACRPRPTRIARRLLPLVAARRSTNRAVGGPVARNGAPS